MLKFLYIGQNFSAQYIKIGGKSLNKKIINRKFKYIIIGLILLILILFLNQNNIKYYVKKHLSANGYTELNLTQEQKTEDFEYMYNVFSTSMILERYKNSPYNIDIENKKNTYADIINNTKSDFEFYCALSAIVEDIPSYHTDVVFPKYSSYQSLGCYNLDSVLAKKDVKDLSLYWNNCINDQVSSFDKAIATYRYVEGNYIFDEYNSDNTDTNEICNSKIISINSIPVNTYIQDKVSMFSLKYDYKRNVVYRTGLAFCNPDSNNPANVSVKLQLDTGEIVSKEWYTDINVEAIAQIKYMYNGKSNNYNPIYAYDDNENNVNYIAVYNFSNSYGTDLLDYISNFDKKNIIVDLRDNYGGSPFYAQKYLYPNLYDSDVNFSYEWLIKKSKYNKPLYSSFRELILNNYSTCTDTLTDDNTKLLRGNEKINYKGNAENNKNVYYLINDGTASAADGYISMIKNNKLGVIVGTNTSGEGLIDSYCVYSLPNSGIVFVYEPSTSYNPDGTDNSLYGTAPNIYVEQTEDSFIKQRLLLEDSDINIYEYNNMLKWDNQLQFTLDLIKQENNQ